MRHDLDAQGEAFGLRPLTTGDAAFIVQLRTDPDLGKYLHATSPSVDDQIAWTQRYFDRPGDWYFVVFNIHTGESEGAIAIYNFDSANNDAEWGRWILRKGSLAAMESAALVYDTGFTELNLAAMYCHTEQDNLPVVSFHSSMGSTTVGPLTGPEGERWIEQRMTAQDWQTSRPLVVPKLARLARAVSR